MSQEPERLLLWPQVQAQVSLSRTSWWRLISRGEAPAPIPISPGRVAWTQSAISEWVRSKIAACHTGKAA